MLSSDPGREVLERILADAKSEVTRMLQRNRHLVEALRDALLERDELVGDDIGGVIGAAEEGVIDLRGTHRPG